MDKHDVKILNEETLYQGFITLKCFELQHKLFAGGWTQPIKRELVVRPRVGAALPYDPILDKVVLLEQFRIGALEDVRSPWSIELVAGLQAPNENIEALIHREAMEEAGLKIQALTPICQYWPSPGGSCENVSLYCAKVDASQASGIFGLAEEHEDIRIQTYASDEAFAMLNSGKINNAASIIALQWLQLNKEKLQKNW